MPVYRGMCSTGLISTILFILFHVSKADNCAYVPEVSTSLGRIRGQAVKFSGICINQYLGVPFAVPPLGNLRYKKPVPIPPWNGTIQATKQPPACMQYSKDPFPWYDYLPNKSEDCLYLNIWTPSDACPENLKAVFFWIHGGGFYVGSNRMYIYNGEVLSAVGDVIVVTVNYRLSSFGFLYSGSDDAPGNMGMWDILTALKWVNANILAFGGNPNKVTIAGESAGSFSVGLLSYTPVARGLYSRQIMQSGSPVSTITPQILDETQRFAELVGCASETFTIEKYPQEVVKCLKSIDAQTLAIVDESLSNNVNGIFIPRYGDELFPKTPRQALKDGDFQSNSLIIGVVRDEGPTIVTTRFPEIFGFFGEKDPPINKTLGRNILQQFLTTYQLNDTDSLLNHYLPRSVPEDDFSFVRQQVMTVVGDIRIVCPVVYLAESYVQRRENVLFYVWSQRPNTSPWALWMGVNHFVDVEFVFGLPVKQPFFYYRGEQALSYLTMDNWSSFTKYGIPSSTWPYYMLDDREFLYFRFPLGRTGKGPDTENCNFLRPYFGLA